MKLIVTGSGSSGNGYILESEKEILLLEAGIKPRETASHINADKNVVGVLPLHRHSDHAKYSKEYSKRFAAPLYSNEDVIARYGTDDDITMEEGKTYAIGSFRVTPFELFHDVPTQGVLVYHKEMGTLLYVSDSFALPFEFRNVNHFLFECNYADEILEDNLRNGNIDKSQYTRIVTTHMSLYNCINNLKLCHAEEANDIVLIHLSSRNSDSSMFKKKVEAEFGVPTFYARSGLTVDITKV